MNHDPIDLSSAHLFHKALTLILLDALSAQDPQHVQQHGRQYAQDAADDATRWMAENIPKDWQLDPKYAMVPDDATITMANGIITAKKKFLESIGLT